LTAAGSPRSARGESLNLSAPAWVIQVENVLGCADTEVAVSHPDDGLHDFVRAAWPRLLRTAYLLCGNREDAEDVTQAALVRVVRHWRHVERADDPFAYARAVLVNTANSRWRRARRLRQLTVDSARAEPDPSGSTVRDPAADVVLRDAVHRALAELPPRMRAVLVLRFFEDLTEAQAADTLGCSVGSVKSQTSRGLARLRERLDVHDLSTVPLPPSPYAQPDRRPR
jgi:RNA polymerase sigma-70 factor (sigma-E family)